MFKAHDVDVEFLEPELRILIQWRLSEQVLCDGCSFTKSFHLEDPSVVFGNDRSYDLSCKFFFT